MNNQWFKEQNDYYIRETSTDVSTLPRAIYRLEYNPVRDVFYLAQTQEKFTFPYKVYGTEVNFINRVTKTYLNTKGNLGVLLNGIKGTGKTVTAELICNNLELPVIIISRNFEKSINSFINDLQINCILFFDEYEKIYDDYDSSILTIMDGVLTNEYRKVFLLTTNSMWLNENMISRPGRIRYVKEFKDLSLEAITEIVDDKLKYRKFKEEIIKYISGLKIITVDIVKSIVEEVNIHNESPEKFKDVINVRLNDDKLNIYDITDDKIKDPELIFSNVSISPKIFQSTEHRYEGYGLNVGNKNIGNILETTPDTVKIELREGLKLGTNKSKILTLKLEVSNSMHSSFIGRYVF